MMMTAMSIRWRPMQWPVVLVVSIYLALTYCCLNEFWGFERDSIFGYILPLLAALFTLGLLGHQPLIRTWAIYTPLVALYGFLTAFAQAVRSSSFPGAHASTGDSFLYEAWQFMLVFLFTLPATLLLILPGVRNAFETAKAPGYPAEVIVAARRWYQIPWQNLLAAGCYGAVMYFGIVAALGFPGDFFFRYLLPAFAALMLIGLLLQRGIARYLAIIFPVLALAGVIVSFHIAESMNRSSTTYHYPPGATFTYFACEFIPVFIFTLPAGIVFLWSGIAKWIDRCKTWYRGEAFCNECMPDR